MPYLNKMKGIGMNTRAKKPSRLQPQSMPSLLNIADAKSGKPAPEKESVSDSDAKRGRTKPVTSGDVNHLPKADLIKSLLA